MLDSFGREGAVRRWLFALLTVAGLLLRGTDAAASSSVTMQTTSGPVAGTTDGTVSRFLGIPYAEPPVGALRWRPPVRAHHSTTTIDATAFGAPCPQLGIFSPSYPGTNEDCLTANIWAPAGRGGKPSPVMVFIHGGGFLRDSSLDPQFDGTHLATSGAIVVSFNYRLGQLGYLAHPALMAQAGDGYGNYGFLDQQLLLQWVRENIGRFGGDPANVTLFGQSAGSISICAHLVSPGSAGLFERAIQESGTCSVLTMPLADQAGSPHLSATALGLEFAAALGCDTASDVAACMRAASVSDVLNAAYVDLATVNLKQAHYMPSYGGPALPALPWTTLESGEVNAQSFVGGAAAQDGSFFAAVNNPSTAAELTADMDAILPGHGADFADVYTSAAGGNLFAALTQFYTDAIFTCPAREQARVMSGLRGSSAFLYEFSHVNPANGLGQAFGAFHGSELPYVFGGNFASPFTDDGDTYLEQNAMSYWLTFASSGQPSAAGAPVWQAYSTSGDAFLELADPIVASTGLHAAACNAIAPLLGD
ncbi:MAG: carboxylesterase/lipase family protein [Polyangiaceae bacterium]